MSKKIKVYCAFLSNSTVVDSQSYSIREIEKTYGHLVEFVYPFNCVRRMFHDHARNKAVEDFLASDCDVIWFLDSDITPSIQVMDLVALNYDKWKVAGLTYPVFMTMGGNTVPEVVYTVYDFNRDSGSFRPRHSPMKGKEYVDGLATGCLFIKREVLEEMDAPYFEFSYHKHTKDLTEGEDLNFARKMVQKGYKFFVDFGTICRHQKSVDLLDVTNYAVQYANRAIANYDKQIQGQVVDAIKASHLKGVQEGMAEAAKKKIQIVPASALGNGKWPQPKVLT